MSVFATIPTVVLTARRVYRKNREIELPLRLGKHTVIETENGINKLRSSDLLTMKTSALGDLIFHSSHMEGIVIIPYSEKDNWSNLIEAPVCINTSAVRKATPELFELIKVKKIFPCVLQELFSDGLYITTLERLLLISHGYLLGLDEELLDRLWGLLSNAETVRLIPEHLLDKYLALRNFIKQQREVIKHD